MKIYVKDLNLRQLIAFNNCGFVPVDGVITITEKDLPVKLSKGNKKLISSDYTRFLIYNLPARITCPYATPDCLKFCYAWKAEQCYPSARAARMLHYEQSLKDTFADEMIVTITYWINTPSYKKARFISVRIHESGDFYSVEYLLKWFDIMRAFTDVKNMNFGAYTKSFPFFLSVNEPIPGNLVPTGSLDNSSSDAARADLDKLGFQKYIAIPAADISNGKKYVYANTGAIYDHKCICADCGKCRYCYNRHAGAATVCAIH